MAGSIISLKDVVYQYRGGNCALKDISVEIPKGKKTVLMGANGAGKSTLMLLLNGILKCTNGQVFYKGQPYHYTKKALRELRTKVGFLFPDSDNQLIAPSVYEEIAFGLNNLYTNKALIRSKVEDAIQRFNLEAIQDKSPHQLSSGEKKRVCLASIIAMKPEVLVCDEPASNLDVKHTRITFQILDELNTKGTTILMSTHDVEKAYAWADHVIVMKEGKVLANASPKEIFGNKELLEIADLEQPQVVGLYQSMYDSTRFNDLPSNLSELKEILNQEVCKGLL